MSPGRRFPSGSVPADRPTPAVTGSRGGRSGTPVACCALSRGRGPVLAVVPRDTQASAPGRPSPWRILISSLDKRISHVQIQSFSGNLAQLIVRIGCQPTLGTNLGPICCLSSVTLVINSVDQPVLHLLGRVMTQILPNIPLYLYP